MKIITLVNPSVRLLAAVIRVVQTGYTRTCRSNTCSCASHDSGYDWAEVEINDDFEDQIHTYSGSQSSYKTTCLKQEYVESHTAQGLPANAPEWAYTLENRRSENGYRYGQGVDVESDGDLTVVKLMVSRNSSTQMRGWYVEEKLFATKDGKSDHTKEYRRMRFERLRTKELNRFRDFGLTDNEAERFFKIGKEQWTKEQECLLIENAAVLRQLRGYLRDLSRAVSSKKQMHLADGAGLREIVSGMTCPRTQAFAQKALWIFHGETPDGETEKLPASGDPDVRPALVSLEIAFSKALAS